MGGIVGHTFGIGVYGERALAIAQALSERADLRHAPRLAFMRTASLELEPDGEAAFSFGGAVGCLGFQGAAKARAAIGSRMAGAARALLAESQRLPYAGVPSLSVARLRASEWAGAEVARLGPGGMATLSECLCLAEAVQGRKSREALVRAYGEGTVRGAVGSPADPVTTAAVEAIMRQMAELRGRLQEESVRLRGEAAAEARLLADQCARRAADIAQRIEALHT